MDAYGKLLEDSLTFYAFPMLDARKISSFNMIERLNREICRRTAVVGFFLNKESFVRLVTTYLMKWSVTIKPYTQGDIMKPRKGVIDGTEIHRRI